MTEEEKNVYREKRKATIIENKDILNTGINKQKIPYRNKYSAYQFFLKKKFKPIMEQEKILQDQDPSLNDMTKKEKY